MYDQFASIPETVSIMSKRKMEQSQKLNKHKKIKSISSNNQNQYEVLKFSKDIQKINEKKCKQTFYPSTERRQHFNQKQKNTKNKFEDNEFNKNKKQFQQGNEKALKQIKKFNGDSLISQQSIKQWKGFIKHSSHRHAKNTQRDDFNNDMNTKNTAETERCNRIQKMDSQFQQFKLSTDAQEIDLKILSHKYESNCKYLMRQIKQLIQLVKFQMIDQQKKQYRKHISNLECQVRKFKIGFRTSQSKLLPHIDFQKTSVMKVDQQFNTQKSKQDRLISPNYKHLQKFGLNKQKQIQQLSTNKQEKQNKKQLQYLQQKIEQQNNKNSELSAKIKRLQIKQADLKNKIYSFDKQISTGKKVQQRVKSSKDNKYFDIFKVLSQKKQFLINEKQERKTYFLKKQNKMKQQLNLLQKQIQTIYKKISNIKKTKISQEETYLKRKQNMDLPYTKQEKTNSKIITPQMYGLHSCSKLFVKKQSKIKSLSTEDKQQSGTKHKLHFENSEDNSQVKHKIKVTKRYEDLSGKHEKHETKVYKPQAVEQNLQSNCQLQKNMQRLMKKYNSYLCLPADNKGQRQPNNFKKNMNYDKALYEYFGTQKVIVEKNIKLESSSSKSLSILKQRIKQKYKANKHKIRY